MPQPRTGRAEESSGCGSSGRGVAAAYSRSRIKYGGGELAVRVTLTTYLPDVSFCQILFFKKVITFVCYKVQNTRRSLA